ncbi:MAG TPA: N-acetylglucosamine-6-phosphate deacetylase [Solirubrobacteraceae bacterium]
MRLGVEWALVEGDLVLGDVEITDGRISAAGLNGHPGKGIAAPGFVDLQVNGFGGVDFFSADAHAYARAGEALLETGVTAYQPTLITASEDELRAALGEVPPNGAAPHVLGAHLEGPFLAPERLGTHPAGDRRDPDVAFLECLLAAGPVAHMTLAPELPGALDLVDLLRARGVTVACGHSNATAEEARRAFDRGARTVTHIFNAMRPFEAREPGLAGAALACEDVAVQVILDGVHLADDTARLVWRAAAGRMALVTDAVSGAGVGDGDGSYRLGSVEVEIENGVVRRADSVLAGSTVTMIEAVRNLVELGAPLAGALSAASEVPARVAGRSDVGSLRPGATADVVVLDDSLQIQRVLAAGEDEL